MEEGIVGNRSMVGRALGRWARWTTVAIAVIGAVPFVPVVSTASALSPGATSGGGCSDVCFEVAPEYVREGADVFVQTRAATTQPTPRQFRVQTKMLDGTGGSALHPWAAAIPNNVPAFDQVITIPANLAATSTSIDLPFSNDVEVDRPFEVLLTDLAGTVLDRRTITIINTEPYREVGFLEQSEPPLLYDLDLTLAEGEVRTLNISQFGGSLEGPVDMTLVEEPIDPASQTALMTPRSASPSAVPPSDSDYRLDGAAIGEPISNRFNDGGQWLVELDIPSDNEAEGAEQYTIALYAMPSAGGALTPIEPLPGGSILRPATALLHLTIVDTGGDDQFFVAEDEFVDEGNPMQLIVHRNGSRVSSVIVPISYIGVTAQLEGEGADVDLSAAPHELVFEPGVETISVIVPTTDNEVWEDVETFQVQLGTPSEGTVLNGTTTVTLADNGDYPIPTFTPGGEVFIDEPFGGETFRLHLPQAALVDVTYQVSTVASANAAAGEDYEPFALTVTFPAGTTQSAPFDLTVLQNDDPLDLQSESLSIEARGTAPGFLNTVVATSVVTILDSTLLPRARVVRVPSDPLGEGFRRQVTEEDVDAVTVTLEVRLLNRDPSKPYRVDFLAQSLMDIEGRLTISPAFVTFQPGETDPKFVFVTFTSDDVRTGDLRVTIALQHAARFNTSGQSDDDGVVTLIDDEAPPVDSTGDELRAAIEQMEREQAADYADALNAPDVDWPAIEVPEPEVPLVPPATASAFGVGPQMAAQPAYEFDPLADTMEALVADMEAAGCPADFALGGAGGKPEPTRDGDIIQVTCVRTLSDLLVDAGFSGDLNGATPDALQALANALGLDVNIAWTADLRITITAGVDENGVYVLGNTGVELGVSGVGQVVGAGTVLGQAGTDLDGTGEANLFLSVRSDVDATARLRAADLASLQLFPIITGTASLDLTAVVDNSTLDWAASWTLTEGVDGATETTTTQELQLTQELPGFAVGGVNAPTALVLVGTLTEREGVQGWAVEGSLTPADELDLRGFVVTQLDGSGFIAQPADGPATVDLTVDVSLVIGEGATATTVDLTLHIDGEGWSAGGVVTSPEFTVGPLHVEDATLTFAASYEADAPMGLMAGLLPTGAAPPSPGLSLLVSFNADLAEIRDSTGAAIATLTGVSGRLEGTQALHLDADTLTAAIGTALELDIDTISLDVPAVDGVLLSLGEVVATAPSLGGLTVTVTDLKLFDDGRFSASSAVVAQPAGFATSLGLGGIIPVDLTALRLEFTDVAPDGTVQDLSSFIVRIDGIVDMSRFASLPFTPTVQLGGAVITPTSPIEDRRFSLAAHVQSTDPLVIVPTDIGPIGLGLQGLEVGEVTIDASITVDGLEADGSAPTVAGNARIAAAFDDLTGSIEATLAGSVTDGAHGAELNATAVVGFSAATSGGASLEDLQGTFEIRLAFGDPTEPFTVDLTDVSLGSLRVPAGTWATFTAGDIEIDLTPAADTLITIDGSLGDPTSGIGLTLNESFEALSGFGLRVGGITFDRSFTPRFTNNFFADLDLPDDMSTWLPKWLPLQIDGFGLQVPTTLDPGSSLVDVFSQLQISVSGGLRGTPAFPVSATVNDLVIDLGRLIDFDPLAPFDADTFPVVNLSGVRLAIEPALNLGAARISGELTFGTVQVELSDGVFEEVVYGRIRGGLSSPAIDAGADLVITEYGPVLLRVTAPLGVPLGPTGLMLTSVTGAAAFGDVSLPTPRPGHPEDLINAIIDLPTDASLDEAGILAAVTPSVLAGVPTWTQGLALALEGDLTHVATVGMVKGKVTVGINLSAAAGTQIIGRGEVEVFGIPLTDTLSLDGSLAVAGIMISLGNPLAPQIDLAFQSPTPGSPFAVVFPEAVTVSAQLRTDGILTGIAAGLDAFIDSMSSGALTSLASSLESDRSSALSRLVLDTNGDETISPAEAAVVITPSVLQARLAALLADPVRTVGPLLQAISDDLAQMDLGGVAEAVTEFLDITRTAGAAALSAAGEAFNPSLTISGAMQPLMLGIPMGEPTNAITVSIDRTSLRFEVTTSIIENLKDLADKVLPGSSAILTTVTLGGHDSLTFGIQVPVPSLMDVILFGGSLPTFDPELPSQNWSINFAGSFTQFGMQAEVSGFITSAGNQTLVDQKVQRRYPGAPDYDPTVPADASKVQFTRQVDYDNLLRFGGIVLNGRLEVPRLITDPVDVIRDLPPIPEGLQDALPWFDQFGDTLLATETPIQLTVLIPGFTAVFDTPAGAAREAAFDEWVHAFSVSGVFEGTRQTEDSDPVARLLSIPIGEGRLLATAAGLEITANIPLIGVEGTFTVKVDTIDGIPVPSGGVELSLDVADALAALRDLGLPEALALSNGDGASFGFRAFTPGFDPDSEDALRRSGGIGFSALLDLAGFVEDAQFDLAIDPVGTGFGPDFSATAAVGQIGPFAGAGVRDAVLTMRKLGDEFSMEVDGVATLLGLDWTLDGALGPDLTGQLTLLGSGSDLPNVGGFQFVEGGFALQFTRSAAGALQASVGIGGKVALPTWLAGRVGGTAIVGPEANLAATAAPTVTVAGCTGPNDALELRLAIGTVRLNADGTAALTGTGQPLAIDPDAPCVLPPNVLGLDDDDARLVVRRLDGVTSVAIDGAVVVGGGLPTFTIGGSLATDGTGTLRMNFDSAGLGLGGFLLTGGADLTLLGGNSFRLAVDARTSIAGLVANARVTGDITNTGIQSLNISATGITIPNVTIDSATLTLLKVGSGYRVDAAAKVRIRNVSAGSPASSVLDVTGSVQPNGNFSLGFALTNARLLNVPFTGSLFLEKTGSAVTVRATSSYTLWSTTFKAGGSLTVGANGLSGSLLLTTVDANGNPATLKLGGYELGGTLRAQFTIAGTTNTASVQLDSGKIVVPGLGQLDLTAALSLDGTGHFSIGTPNGLRLGGDTSPFFGVGTYRLSLDAGVVRFQATSAGIEYRDGTTVVFSAVVPSFRIASNGVVNAATNGFRIGSSSGLNLNVGPASFLIDGPSLTARLSLPAATLHVPVLADGTTGRPRLTTPAFDINVGTFRYVLFDARALDLGLMRLNGRLVFERPAGGALRLAIEANGNGVPFIDLGTMGRVDLPAFSVASNGAIDVTATTTRLGLSSVPFEIRDASFRLQSSGTSLTLAVNGGSLRVPALSQPIDLPDLSFTTATSFTRDFVLPALELGPFFETSQATFRLTIDRNGGRFELVNTGVNGPSVQMFGGSSLRLDTLLITSGGTFSGQVTGQLALFGDKLASATMAVTLENGFAKVTLPASNKKQIDLVFLKVSVSGFARSDGLFSFTGSASTTGNVFGVISWGGSATMTIANTGVSGSFDGDVSTLGLSGGASGAITATGKVTGSLRVDLNGDGRTSGFSTCVPLIGCVFTRESVAYEFQIGTAASADTTAPTMTQPANVSVITSLKAGSIPVYFTQPSANDNRDGALAARCTPGSGSLFTIAATATVTCTARDAAGNSVSKSFTISVRQGFGTISFAGNSVIADVGGFAAGAGTAAAVFSDPVLLAEQTAGGNGRVRYVLTIPADLPPGDHHIVVAGTGADGAPVQWIVPITVGENGQVLAVRNDATVPDRGLPATGGNSPFLLAHWAWGAILLGLALVAGATRRRPRRMVPAVVRGSR